VNRASSWKQLQGIVRRQWDRLASARLDWPAGKASREQVVEWLAREHKRDPIHK
jgi:hypothetical protein